MNDLVDDRSPAMAFIKVERRLARWPMVLATMLVLLGLAAVAFIGQHSLVVPVAPVVEVTYQGQTWASRGTAIQFPDSQMRHVGATDSGIELYAPLAELAGGGGGRATTTARRRLYFKTGKETYLVLLHVKDTRP